MAEVQLSSVLIYLAVVVTAAKLGGEIFSRMRQLPVVGELIFGMLLGPFVAGQISTALFGCPMFINLDTSAGEIVSVFGNIGIIILIFLAGISIDIGEFKKAGKSAALIAFLGVVVSFIFGFIAAWVLGWGSNEAAFLGCILTATSVGITVRALMDIRKLHTPVGVAILEAAVIDDVFGIVILSVLSGISLGSLSIFGVSKTIALMAAFVVLVLILGFRFLPRLMRALEKFHVEEAVLAFAVVIMFMVSALAELVSLAAITGAFLAGLIMSRLPAARTLSAKISSMGYAIFIPVFFTEMGIRMNFGELAGIGLVAGIVVLVVAFFSKIVGCGAGARAGGFSWMDSLRVGVGMVPRAEVALVVAAIGVKAGVVQHALLSVTVLIVLVTSVVTPFLIKRLFRSTQKETQSEHVATVG